MGCIGSGQPASPYQGLVGFCVSRALLRMLAQGDHAHVVQARVGSSSSGGFGGTDSGDRSSYGGGLGGGVVSGESEEVLLGVAAQVEFESKIESKT